MAAPAKTVRTEHPYIVRTPGVVGGRPRVDGTRLAVWFIARCANDGSTPEELASTYANLTLASVHDALSYYHDHKADVDAEIEENSYEAALASGFFNEMLNGYPIHRFK